MRMDDDDPTAAPGAAPAWLTAWWVDVTTALAFLTRLPLPLPEPDRPPDLARATRAMPLVGAMIGFGGAAIYWLSGALGLTPAIAGLLAVAATILLTGALHEDGLADSADGLFAGAEPARQAAGVVYLQTRKSIRAIAIEDGTRLWRTTITSPATSPAIVTSPLKTKISPGQKSPASTVTGSPAAKRPAIKSIVPLASVVP